MQRRDFIKNLSTACLGTALARGSLELAPSNTQVKKPVKQDHFATRGCSSGYDCIIFDEYAFIPKDVYENVVAGFTKKEITL